MNQSNTTQGSAAQHFRHSPEYIAQEVTKDWHTEHPDWTSDDVLFTYEYLLDIYRQARAWWTDHPQASDEELRRIYHEIVKAYLRGERLIPLPGFPSKKVLSPEQRRAQHDTLWNTYTPAEKAQFEYRSWLVFERVQGRKPDSVERQGAYDAFVRKHEVQPRTAHPISSEILGYY